MALKNTSTQFGILTKILHWVIFLLFILQYYLIFRRPYFPKEAPEKIEYLLLHKSIGVLVFGLALFMLLWRQMGSRPAWPVMSKSMFFLAKITHGLLYVVMLFMPFSGMAMSFFSGRVIPFFGLFDFPLLDSKNEAVAQWFYASHVWCAYFVMALVSLHILGAFYHHFIKKDEVLKRMRL